MAFCLAVLERRFTDVWGSERSRVAQHAALVGLAAAVGVDDAPELLPPLLALPASPHALAAALSNATVLPPLRERAGAGDGDCEPSRNAVADDLDLAWRRAMQHRVSNGGTIVVNGFVDDSVDPSWNPEEWSEFIGLEHAL